MPKCRIILTYLLQDIFATISLLINEVIPTTSASFFIDNQFPLTTH